MEAGTSFFFSVVVVVEEGEEKEEEEEEAGEEEKRRRRERMFLDFVRGEKKETFEIWVSGEGSEEEGKLSFFSSKNDK